MLLNLRHMVLVACALLVMAIGLQSALNPQHNLKTASAAAMSYTATGTTGDTEADGAETLSGPQHETTSGEDAAVAPQLHVAIAFATPVAPAARPSRQAPTSRIAGALERPPRG